MFHRSGVNKAFLIGQIAEEPQLQTVSGYGEALYFTLITSETVYKGGKALKRSEQHSVVLSSELAATIPIKITKGQVITLEGRLQTRNYLDEQQHKRHVVEVIVSSFEILRDQTAAS